MLLTVTRCSLLEPWWWRSPTLKEVLILTQMILYFTHPHEVNTGNTHKIMCTWVFHWWSSFLCCCALWQKHWTRSSLHWQHNGLLLHFFRYHSDIFYPPLAGIIHVSACVHTNPSPGIGQPRISTLIQILPLLNQERGLTRMYRATTGTGKMFWTGISFSLLPLKIYWGKHIQPVGE